MPITYYARGDNGTANNVSINSQGVSTTPVTEISFRKKDDPDSDNQLEYNGGDPDPDTWLVIDGVEREFTVELIGNLPNSSKFASIDDGQGGTIDLRGAEVAVITDELTGQRYWFLTDPDLQYSLTMLDMPNGAISITGTNSAPPPVVICFATGTRIDTPDGPRRVEDLRPGDLVDTDVGPQPLKWLGMRRVSAAELSQRPRLRPIEISAGALGADVPSSTVTVSPNHRIQLASWFVELVTGELEALCPAKHLVNGTSIRQIKPDGVSYVHLMFDTHRIVFTQGLASESFEPGPVGLSTLSAEARAEVEELFGTDLPCATGLPATPPTLRRDQAIVLRNHITQMEPAYA